MVSNNCGVDGFGLGILLENRQIKKMISSYVGENKLFEQLYLSAASWNWSSIRRSSLVERICAGGGVPPAFFTRTGACAHIAEGR